MACCSHIFSDFTFADIRHAQPPSNKGVYAIRVAKRGASADNIIRDIKPVLVRLDFPLLADKFTKSIARLNRIEDCPIIYIGSAGTRDSSKHTLLGRYRDFAGRHTIMYPIWCLLYFDWCIDYGFRETDSPSEFEAKLKSRFRERHGRLPALVHR
jgi:hypothetical protein